MSPAEDAPNDHKQPGKKCPCCDCTFCQWCSDDRCSLCRRVQNGRRKLSLHEQIAYYEEVSQQHKK